MRIDRPFLALLFFIAFSQVPVFSQTKPAFDPYTDEIKDKLPPLSVLIDSAIATDPNVQFKMSQKIVEHCKLKEVQYNWSRNMGLDANLGYGTFDYLYNSSLGGNNTPSTYTTSQNLNQYGVGAFIRFPVFDLMDRRNQIKIAKITITQSQQMIEERIKEIRNLVISQYNNLIVKQHLLKIHQKALETTRINMQMAENEFTNGTISLTEYSRISEIVSSEEAAFETSKMDFQNAYMLFEELVGMKLNIY